MVSAMYLTVLEIVGLMAVGIMRVRHQRTIRRVIRSTEKNESA